MKKLIKDGKVAVVISPGYGAGWSTWASESIESLMFDASIAQAVLDGDIKGVVLAAKAINPNLNFSTMDPENLEVVWIDEGAKFKIDEYDGHESILTVDDFMFTA